MSEHVWLIQHQPDSDINNGNDSSSRCGCFTVWLQSTGFLLRCEMCNVCMSTFVNQWSLPYLPPTQSISKPDCLFCQWVWVELWLPSVLIGVLLPLAVIRRVKHCTTPLTEFGYLGSRSCGIPIPKPEKAEFYCPTLITPSGPVAHLHSLRLLMFPQHSLAIGSHH